MVEELKDPAQDLYKDTIDNNEKKDNNLIIASLLTIASITPIINLLNIFFIYNIMAIIFSFRILKKDKNNKVFASLIIGANIILILIFIFLMISHIMMILNTY